ncbi:MAG: aldehyde dehydrogenase [Phycisphaerales bacterium]
MTTATSTAAPAATQQTLTSINPATGEAVGQVPVTAPADIAAVVARARAAQAAWSELTPAERADRLRPAGEALAAAADEIGELLTREMGKPLAEATGEVRSCGRGMGSMLDSIVAALAPEHHSDSGTESHVHYDPFGVCAAITPWNFPVAMPHQLVVPALVAGNTVVLKPSEQTPLVAQAYFDVLLPHLPEDVLHIIHGADDQGRTLVDADVDLIAFTGSREVGQKILTAAGRRLTRVILELGGKDPMIVLDDADVENAAAFAARNAFRNAGQVCVSTERIYVHERIANAFEEAFIAKADAMPVGNGLDEGVRIGPMVSDEQRDHVLGQVRRAIDAGATLRHGAPEADGRFIRPIVLTGVDHDMEIMREETFGPVACVMQVSDDDQAVMLANDTPFGLGAAVFGGDETRAAAVARRLRAGMIGVNRSCGGADGTPWVGAGQSGYGYHSGRDGHRQFAQARVVSRAADRSE